MLDHAQLAVLLLSIAVSLVCGILVYRWALKARAAEEEAGESKSAISAEDWSRLTDTISVRLQECPL